MNRFAIWVFAIGCVLLPLTADATCCKCVDKNNPGSLCLTTSAESCTDIVKKSTNTSIQGTVSCAPTGLTDATCKAKSENGVCAIGPVDVSTYESKAAPPAETQKVVSPPELNIPIPELTFAKTVDAVGGKLQIPFLSQYISAIYTYLLSISLIVASVMIIYGGFLYLLGGSMSSATEGKKYIEDALIGVFLLFGTYGILNIVAPDTLTMKPLEIQQISKAPDQDWLDTYGTGNIDASTGPMDRVHGSNINGSSRRIKVSMIKPPPDSFWTQEDMVDISDIPFDRKLGGPKNLNEYCTPKAEASQAKTYKQKIKLLAKAVLGFQKVCADNKLCAYCQGGATSIPGGGVACAPMADAALNNMTKLGITTPEEAWSRYPECLDIWYRRGDYAEKGKGGPYAMMKIAYCRKAVLDVYQDRVVPKLQEAKMFVGDCGTFAWNVYRCANADYLEPGKEVGFLSTGEKQSSPYVSEKSIGKYDDRIDLIYGGHMDGDIAGAAAKKGGFKFGDVMYTCCGGDTGTYSAHWSMYTGGRPDMPFSWIEMGGGQGVNVPGVGHLSGVHNGTNIDIPSVIAAKGLPRKTEFKNPKGKVVQTIIQPPSTNLSKGVVFIWRPYADETSNLPLTPAN